MSKTIKYIGTQTRWPELAATGKQSVWNPGQQEERSDAEAAALMATTFFIGLLGHAYVNYAGQVVDKNGSPVEGGGGIQVAGTPGVGNTLTALFPSGTGAVKWQRADVGSTSWVDISGATSLTYVQVTADAGKQVRPIATSYLPAGSSTTVPGGATVVPPTIIAQPVAQAVTAPAAATFAIAANTGGGTLAYQWRKGGVNISGATGSSYTTPATVVGDSGSQYDCVVSNSAGSVISNAVALTVSASAGLPAGALLLDAAAMLLDADILVLS